MVPGGGEFVDSVWWFALDDSGHGLCSRFGVVALRSLPDDCGALLSMVPRSGSLMILAGVGMPPPFKRVAKKCFANGVTASPKITQILAFFVWVYAFGALLCLARFNGSCLACHPRWFRVWILQA